MHKNLNERFVTYTDNIMRIFVSQQSQKAYNLFYWLSPLMQHPTFNSFNLPSRRKILQPISRQNTPKTSFLSCKILSRMVLITFWTSWETLVTESTLLRHETNALPFRLCQKLGMEHYLMKVLRLKNSVETVSVFHHPPCAMCFHRSLLCRSYYPYQVS